MSMMVRTMAASSAVDGDVADERLVDLQRADRKLLQRRQRRVAGAEIVDGEIQAHRIQLVQQPMVRFGSVIKVVSVTSSSKQVGETSCLRNTRGSAR